MRKTIRLTVFICIILLSFALVFTACNNNEEPNPSETSAESETQESETQKPDNTPGDTTEEHIHSWGEWEIVKYATCISEGEQRCSCDCGEIQIEILLITEHIQTTGPLVAVAPTCKDKGLTEGKMCAVCGEILVAQEEVPATGHYEVEITKPATCTETGLSGGKKCLLCNTVTKAPKVVDALGHDIKTVPGKAATCEDDGLTAGEYCDRCEDRETGVERQEIIPAGHQWVAHEQPATCKMTGKKGEWCSICHEWNKAEDATVPYEETPTGPHNFENGVCTERGCGATEDGTLDKPYSLAADRTYEIEAEGSCFYTYTAEGDVTLSIITTGSDTYDISYADNTQVDLPITLNEGQTIVICIKNNSTDSALSFSIELN